MDLEQIKKIAYEKLSEVYDPEIPINVVDLGLIYDLQVKSLNNIFVLMTLTSPHCPLADDIVDEIKEALLDIDSVKIVDVELTFDPTWTPDLIKQEK